jgi:Family of unknown function (DUF6055)
MTPRSKTSSLLLGLALMVASCNSGGASTTGKGGSTPSGGSNGTGGQSSTGPATGGAPGSGGSGAIGGKGGAGGQASTGGAGGQGGGSGGATRQGGATGSGGKAGAGGTSSTGGSGPTGSGGRLGSGGIAGGGGGSGSGGSTGLGGTGGAGGSTGDGTCDQGTKTTTWASNCPTAPPTTCTAGTWTAGGPDPDHSTYSKISESDHFAIYSNESVSSSTAQSALTQLESIWSLYFGSPMFEREPLCNSATKYKAAIHVNSANGLSGGAWDAQHMGMWISSDALSDHWGLAHEFMHGVQSVEGGLACNQSNTCGWIYESHANWAAQQQTEYHTTDVHCSEYLANVPHLYLGSTRDRYCNWQFMEYLKDKYCYSAVNAIWTGKAVNDPFTAILNAQGWNIGQLNDFIGEWAMHNVTWDYQDPAPESTAGGNQGKLFRSKYGLITDSSQTTRRLRLTKVEPLDTDYANNRRFISPFYWAPQRFGYNVIRLYPDSGATSVTVSFRGVTSAAPSPDWRWGLVATDSGITTARYSAMQKGSDAELTFCVSAGESLFLVVAATPSTQQQIVWDQAYGTVPRYPFMIQLANAWPDGFQGGKQDACPSGLTRASNGGGCAPSGTVAYVGPYATVSSGATVGSSARIDDHAYVESGSTVSAGTVAALSLIGSKSGSYNNNAFTLTSGTVRTTFYPLGFFESGQGLSGGTLVGDVEYRGANYNRTSGTCSGFVDSATCTSPGTDNTPAPPYTWRN